MRNDFTLVVPTYNRSSDLAFLLSYLQAQSAPFRILVLDSSKEAERLKNRNAIAAVDIEIDYHEFDIDTHPFDKFRAGIKLVETPYCCLCADDDIPLLEGISKSVQRLKDSPDFSVAHGYYFQFAHQPNAINLASITYYTPDIADADPVGRVHTLMRHYQALTYGVYRTPVLCHIFDAVRPVTSLLGRELLSSTLAVVQGKVARVNCFYMGRNLGPSSGHVHWHPLEWSIKSPENLFAEYSRYREILTDEILDQSDNKRSKEDVKHLLDLIHLHYYVRHAPEESLDFSVDAVSAGRPADEIFGAPEVTHPLIHAAARYSARGEKLVSEIEAAQPALDTQQVALSAAIQWRHLLSEAPGIRHIRHVARHFPEPLPQILPAIEGSPRDLRRLAAQIPGLRRLKRTVSQLSQSIPIQMPETPAATESVDPPVNEHVRTEHRDYILQPDFHTPPKSNGVVLTPDDRLALLAALDKYA